MFLCIYPVFYTSYLIAFCINIIVAPSVLLTLAGDSKLWHHLFSVHWCSIHTYKHAHSIVCSGLCMLSFYCCSCAHSYSATLSALPHGHTAELRRDPQSFCSSCFGLMPAFFIVAPVFAPSWTKSVTTSARHTHTQTHKYLGDFLQTLSVSTPVSVALRSSPQLAIASPRD